MTDRIGHGGRTARGIGLLAAGAALALLHHPSPAWAMQAFQEPAGQVVMEAENAT